MNRRHFLQSGALVPACRTTPLRSRLGLILLSRDRKGVVNAVRAAKIQNAYFCN